MTDDDAGKLARALLVARHAVDAEDVLTWREAPCSAV